MADITTKTVSSLTSDSTLSETDAFVYGDAGGNTLKKSALSVLRNALFGATTLPSALATSAKNVIGAINELNTNLTSLTAKTTGSGTLNSTYVSSGRAAYTKFGRLCYMDVHFKYTAAASGTWTGQRLVASGLPKPLFDQYVTNVATDNEKSDSWFIIKTNGDLCHVSRGTDMASKESYMGFLYITAS